MGIKRITTRILQWHATRSDEAGQGLAEYGLILALLALVCIGALSALGVGIRDSAGFVALPQTL